MEEKYVDTQEADDGGDEESITCSSRDVDE